MGLVAVAEFGGERGPVHPVRAAGPLQGVVQAVAEDDPLGRDAHPVGEEPLQGADRQPGVPGEGGDPAHRAVGADPPRQLHGLPRLRSGVRAPCEEQGVEGGDAPVLVVRSEDGGGLGGGAVREAPSRPSRDRPVRCEGPEAAGPELDAAHPAGARQPLGEEFEADPGQLSVAGGAAGRPVPLRLPRHGAAVLRGPGC
ncbi:hypothetical protein GCM10009757_35870 [Streptomyces cheonanensis]|uniref:Uncharacterized protein n=1 Tax=Streptomyces cheonanensis TaxID=312720 RepID=A0ABP5H1B5_9ACTN